MFDTARDESTVVRIGRRLAERTRTAVRRSRLGTHLGRIASDGKAGSAAADGSTTSPAGDDSATPPTDDNSTGSPTADDSSVSSPLETLLAGSAIRGVVTETNSRLRTGASRARITTFGRSGRQYVTSSFGYRWLTAEPDPDVIVIDLRETRTIGPFIAALDRALDGLATAASTSVIADFAARIGGSVRDRPIAIASLFVLSALVLSIVVLGTALSPALFGLQLVIAIVAVIGLRSRQSLEDLLETRIVRLLAAAFEPPEPPADEKRTDDQTDETDDDQR